MKKLYLLLVCLLIAFSVNAQTYYYRTTEFAYKYVSNGSWTGWSDWQNSFLKITINLDNDIVKINSETPQIYRITRYVKNYTDNSGGQQVMFSFVDQDYDRGTMRLRVERNGNSQIYIEFSDVMWVYNVIRIR